MKTQLPIGSIFNYEYVELEVKEGGCKGCYFVKTNGCIGYIRNCMSEYRTDGKNVNYQEVKFDVDEFVNDCLTNINWE